MIECSTPGCGREATCRGMCEPCRQRWRRANRPGVARPVRHAALVEPFGGLRAFCRAVGIETMTVYRWPDGAVPADRHGAILDGAARAGVDIGAVRRALGA